MMIDLSGVMGWFAFQPYYESIFKRLPSNARVLEIGVYEGLSTCYFADLIRSSGKSVEFHCCDIFERLAKSPAHYTKDYGDRFLANLKKFDLGNYVNVHRGLSVDVLNSFEDRYFDFIFVDGDHECLPVFRDVSLALRKVKHRGIVAGHDESWGSVRCGLQRVGIQWKVFVGDVWQANLMRLQ